MDDINQKILSSTQSGDVLKVIYQAYLNDRNDPEENLLLVLSSLHNQQQINIIEVFLKLDRTDAARDFFSLRHVFSKILPLLQSPVLPVMACVKHLTMQAADDMTSGLLIGPFMEFCRKTPSRIDEVLSMALENIDDHFDFVSPSLIAGSEYELQRFFEIAIGLVSNVETQKEIVKRAIFSLGRMRYELIEQSRKAFETIVYQVGDLDSATFSECIRALFNIYLQNPSLDKDFLKFIACHQNKFDDLAIHSVSEALYFNDVSIAQTVEEQLLHIISKLKPESTGTINNVDWILKRLLEKERVEDATKLYEEICAHSKGDIPLEKFDSFSARLLDNPSQILSKTITKWFLSRNAKLCRQVTDLFQNSYSDRNITVECDLSQIANVDGTPHLFLARKAIGWLYMRPITAISFVISMIESCPKSELMEIENVCFQPLLISYPGSVGDYLKTHAKDGNKPVKLFCKSLLSRLKNYHDGFRALPAINELKPSEQDRHIFNRRQQRLMNESMKLARKKSVFLDVIQESVILYGNKSISYIHLTPDNKVRQEIPLHQFRTSVEFPSLQILDPHHLDLSLRAFRIEGCYS